MSVVSSEKMAFTSKFARSLVNYSIENELARIESRLYAQNHMTNPQEHEESRKGLREHGLIHSTSYYEQLA